MDRSPKVWKALTVIGIVCDDVINDAANRLTDKNKTKAVCKIFFSRVL